MLLHEIDDTIGQVQRNLYAGGEVEEAIDQRRYFGTAKIWRGRHPDWAVQATRRNHGDGCVPVCQERSSIGEKTWPFEREAQSAGRSRDQTNTRLLFQLLKRDRHR